MELLIRETVRRELIMKALFQSQFYEVEKWNIIPKMARSDFYRTR